MIGKTIISLVSVLFIAHIIHLLGIFSTNLEYQEKYSDCEYLQTQGFDSIGPEDSVFYNKDILITMQANLYKAFEGMESIETVQKGGFYAVYGISTGKLEAKKIQIKNYPDNIFLIPHGIYLRDSNYLSVINHSFYTGGERVETFRILLDEKGQVALEYLHYTKMDDKFNGITNDLVFLTSERFLISDCMVFPAPLSGPKDQPAWQKVLTFVTQILKIKTTYVWDCKYVQGGLATCGKLRNSAGIMINGIAFDGNETIAVADTADRQIKLFRLNNSNKEIELIQNISVDQLPDNITYDPVNKQFISAGLNSAFEYLTLSPKIEQIQKNPTKKSIVDMQAKVHTIKLNPITKQFESQLLLSSSKAVAGISGALIDESQKYLFLTSFPDKSLVVCTRRSQ
ncbi:hypothetical protein ABPG72_003385 [Tetrahymena utriculariae]